MLDLKELEKRVDEVIANDTPEEMMEWLLKKRMKEFSDKRGCSPLLRKFGEKGEEEVRCAHRV